VNLAAVNSPLLSVRSMCSLCPCSASVAAYAPDGVHNLSLATKDDNPHVAGEVVDEQPEVALSSRCRWCNRATQVPVHECEVLLGSEARLLEKGEPPLFRQHADIVELLHVVKARQASYIPLSTEPLQGLEVKVPEALVPLPPSLSQRAARQRGCAIYTLRT
jgi:hypothetical protein